MAREIPTRFRMPPESWAGYLSPVSGDRFTSLRQRATRSWQYSSSRNFSSSVMPSRMFSNTDIESNRAPFWKT